MTPKTTKPAIKTYKKSEEWLERALKSIPLGSQTFSKSTTQFPLGVSPYFITHGKGSRVWDVDGHEYIDLINGLASITLGYNDPDVTSAVQAQLTRGTIFSLSHPLETQVAEKLIEMVPCAQKVRFGKNGSDATSAAIRLSRAFTSRDHIAVCGYHGWHDWYIGATTRNLGVPNAVSELTHTFTYNNLESLEAIFAAYPDQIAAVILEPMNVTEPANGFLHSIRDLTHEHKSLLVFDETITGFRFANGGAQQLFNVTPDLASFGKGLANGYPVSAIAGRADVMRLMEDVFVSTTFGGETLSLAAALATMAKLQAKPVLQQIAETGNLLKTRIQQLIAKHTLENCLSISGHPSWTFLIFQDSQPYSLWDLKTLFLQEIFAGGVLSLGTNNMSFAHSEQDIETIASVYDSAFGTLHEACSKGNLNDLLRCSSLKPLFKIR